MPKFLKFNKINFIAKNFQIMFQLHESNAFHFYAQSDKMEVVT
jgi:hypothetical protein